MTYQSRRIWAAAGIILALLFVSPAPAQDPSARDEWQALNRQVMEAYHAGEYARGADLAERAYEVAVDAFGETHPDTLGSLNNMAFLYSRQGRYGEAEPLYARALELSRQTLGETHPQTLGSLNNMAGLYSRQGRYGEAEPLFARALELRRQTLGETHPDTLQSLNNMASLYSRQGRYGEAEPLYARALELSRQTLGETHPDTLISLNNMAFLYYNQGRYGEAEPLYARALEVRRQTLGETHPDTLTSLNNMAVLYRRQGRYEEAEPLYARALELRRQTLGETHPDTLQSLNNTALLYSRRGRYGEAEPLLARALELRRQTLGRAHPDTLLAHLNTAVNLAAQARPAEAARLLSAMEGPLLDWLGAEIYSTDSTAVARQLVASQRSYLSVALSLAIAHPDQERAHETAASALLRFKGLQAEEEAVIARLVRRGRDPQAGALAVEIRELRATLAKAFHGGVGPQQVEALTQALDTKERALGRLSRDYRDQLKVREANLTDLQGALEGGAVLVEFSRYQLVDFQKWTLGANRWAAVVVQGYDRVEAIDLGPVAGTDDLVGPLIAGGADAQDAGRALYDRLIAPLGLGPDDRVVIAPDGLLHLVPFHRLVMPDGRYWAETATLRQVQSGRDLLRPRHDRPATGLLAIGGVDFDGAPLQVASAKGAARSAGSDPLAGEVERSRAAAAEMLRGGFAKLPGSAREVDEIQALYRVARPAEPLDVWKRSEASEARLLAQTRPPRVLHLATHGFYRAATGAADRPMLLAGIALAGANQALSEAGEDGILYALEAQSLNLEGTELVVLSACETAQGVIGHGEGIYGLVRALRTAGARNVLVTLRTVGDRSAAAFMKTFYTRWLSQPSGRSDPARALEDTRRHYIANDPDFDWTPFVMVGAG